MGVYQHQPAGAPGGTVLIGSDNLLTAWSAIGSAATDVIAVRQEDVNAALEVIRRRQPALVVLEEAFAVSTRAAALVTRLQTDPEFRGVDLRQLTAEGVAALQSAQTAHGHGQVSLAALATPMPSRGAARVRPASPVEILIEGAPAILVNLSTSGMQVLSCTPLRPQQRLTVGLALDSGTINIGGVVIWSTFEVTAAPIYRAGIKLMAALPFAPEEILARLQPLRVAQ
jgi:hypothetical protein